MRYIYIISEDCEDMTSYKISWVCSFIQTQTWQTVEDIYQYRMSSTVQNVCHYSQY